MQRAPQPDSPQEWRLGNEPEPAHLELAPPAPALDPGNQRLRRPLHVVTVEDLAWTLIALWAIVSRLIALGARPLTPGEARNALFAYDLVNRTTEAAAAGFQPQWSGWVHLANAGIFIAGGAGDFAARAFTAIGGLLLIAMAFELRHYAGRAGGIALGAMLTLSPTMTWLSRADNTATWALVLAAVTIALFMALKAQPGAGRALALGVSAGLMIGADPNGAATAVIFVATLALLGLYELVATRNASLRARVWLTRYSHLVTTVIVTAAGVVFASQLATGLTAAGWRTTAGYLLSPRLANWRAGLRAVILPLGFYDFQIMIAGAVGLVIVATLRVRTRFAFFTLFWTLLSCAFAFLLPPGQSGDERLLLIVVPAATLAGVALDYLHRSRAWTTTRWILLGLVLFTLHAQSFVNFDNYAPDPTEAPWARHANLFWRDGATTPQAVERCKRLLQQVGPANATVFLTGDGTWPPALRWYLRGLRAVANADEAGVVADISGAGTSGGAGTAGVAPDAAGNRRIDYEESWRPELASLTPGRAMLYFFTQRAWDEIVTRSAILDASPLRRGVAPTIIVPPEQR